jgi:dTDP-4-amino-4,6-dideoxy-D-galactose acyltransferase
LLTYLPFDSELFGFPVGKYEVGEYWDQDEFLKQTRCFQLVYLISEHELDIKSKDIQLMDVKLVFEKALKSESTFTDNIEVYQGELTEELISLALDSGEYSRFKVDPRLDQGEFEKLYHIWMRKALEKREVLVDGEMEGMVTCKVDNDLAQVGLFAVKESSRGKGIGKDLLKKAESWAFEKGARIMKIPTQKANTPATNLYEKMGYKIASQTNIYHYWNYEFKV